MLPNSSSRKSPRLAGASAHPTPGRATAPMRIVRQRTQSDPGPARTGPALQTPSMTPGQATTASLLSDQAQANAANAAQRVSANAAATPSSCSASRLPLPAARKRQPQPRP
jgi:hypothetical protein